MDTRSYLQGYLCKHAVGYNTVSGQIEPPVEKGQPQENPTQLALKYKQPQGSKYTGARGKAKIPMSTYIRMLLRGESVPHEGPYTSQIDPK